MASIAVFASLANMVRVGTILEIDSEENTAVVSMNEYGATSSFSQTSGSTVSLMQSAVRRTVRILNRGSKNIKDYFNYSVGEKVVCVFPVTLASGSFLTGNGYIAGTFFDENNKPPAFYDKVRTIDFGIGNITVNLDDKSLSIEFDGDISINGKGIYLNG